MQDRQQVIDMLMYLKGSWNVEISKNANQLINFNEWFWAEQVYFVAGMDKKPTGRCGNNDFTKKRYIFIDIDIRNDYLTKNEVVLTDEELDKEIAIIKERLDSNNFDYQILVHSGNWLHIYFCSDEMEISQDEYRNWVEYFISMLDFHLEPIWYRVDSACKNISRLSRLPWSINTRNKAWKYNAWNKEVEILYMNLETKSIWFDFLKEFASKQVEQQEKIREARNAFVTQSNVHGDWDVWVEINRIPMTSVIWDVWNVEIIDRWIDNVAISEWHKNMWAYWYKPNNIIINTWSSLIKNKDKSFFTVFELICLEKFNGNKKHAIEYFKEKFNISPRQASEKRVDRAISEIQPVHTEWPIAFMYPYPFEDFVCILSWEYCVISAATNSWKSSFIHHIMNRQIDDWHSCFYINLEFTIEDIAKKKWLDINNKTKSDLSSNASTLTEEEQRSLKEFVLKYTSRFDYVDKPDWMWCKEFMELITNVVSRWYNFIIVDTVDKVDNDMGLWFAQYDMYLWKMLQKICQDFNVAIVWIKHTNKKWDIWWTYSVQTQAKHIVFIERDFDWNQTIFKLQKDKSVWYKEIEVVRERWEFVKYRWL